MRKMFVVCLIVSVMNIPIFAVSAFPGPVTFKQHDGGRFIGKLKGDEWFGWIEDQAGHVVIYNKNSKRYEYAKLVEKNSSVDLAPSGIPVVDMEDRRPKRLNIPSIDKTTLYKIWQQKRAQAVKVKKR